MSVARSVARRPGPRLACVAHRGVAGRGAAAARTPGPAEAPPGRRPGGHLRPGLAPRCRSGHPSAWRSSWAAASPSPSSTPASTSTTPICRSGRGLGLVHRRRRRPGLRSRGGRADAERPRHPRRRPGGGPGRRRRGVAGVAPRAQLLAVRTLDARAAPRRRAGRSATPPTWPPASGGRCAQGRRDQPVAHHRAAGSARS